MNTIPSTTGGYYCWDAGRTFRPVSRTRVRGGCSTILCHTSRTSSAASVRPVRTRNASESIARAREASDDAQGEGGEGDFGGLSRQAGTLA